MDHQIDELKMERSGSQRPLSLASFRGQKDLCHDLDVFIKGAKERKESLDHVLFYGPPGLGKTTLSEIIAKEMGGGFVSLAAPSIFRSGDLVSVLVSLEPGSILFIDEIHRLPRFIEETLYAAMEDYKVDVVINDTEKGNAVTLETASFTLVGATTRKGMLSQPLLDRFGIPLELRYYDEDELFDVLKDNAIKMNFSLHDEAIREIAKRARGTPRIAIRLLRRVRDYAAAYSSCADGEEIDSAVVSIALERLGVDQEGLNTLDRRYINCIANSFNGGPVGLDTLAATLSEDRETLETTVEPFLLQKGLIHRTARGRILG